ncbi:hypothetical protein EV127DRAFT_414743 [Xylaria flabelliformis]|nr:hypothetical protein EV127DRAFT_414743 [Xylaria flabelliformis]
MVLEFAPDGLGTTADLGNSGDDSLPCMQNYGIVTSKNLHNSTASNVKPGGHGFWEYRYLQYTKASSAPSVRIPDSTYTTFCSHLLRKSSPAYDKGHQGKDKREYLRNVEEWPAISVNVTVLLTCISAITDLSHLTGRPVSRSSPAPAATLPAIAGPILAHGVLVLQLVLQLAVHPSTRPFNPPIRSLFPSTYEAYLPLPSMRYIVSVGFYRIRRRLKSTSLLKANLFQSFFISYILLQLEVVSPILPFLTSSLSSIRSIHSLPLDASPYDSLLAQ